jgi:hypothetical protein
MKLNGWQRLWVVVAVAWICTVLLLGYLSWPTVAEISTSTVYWQLPDEDRRLLMNEYEVTIAEQVRAGAPDASTADKGSTIDIGGHVVQFAPRVQENDMNRVSQHYYSALQRLLRPCKSCCHRNRDDGDSHDASIRARVGRRMGSAWVHVILFSYGPHSRTVDANIRTRANANHGP